MSFQSCIVYETILDFHYFFAGFFNKKSKSENKVAFQGTWGNSGRDLGESGSVKFSSTGNQV